jgi:putative oxidoreductase
MTDRYLPLFGRILLAAIFILSGFNKIMNPAMTEQYMAAHGMPLPQLFLAGAIAVEVGVGLALLAGVWARAAAWALFLFMIPTTWIFHTNFADQNQMIHFMKNLAMMGGLLYVAAYGAGRLSVDAWLDSRGETGVYGATPQDQRERTVA